MPPRHRRLTTGAKDRTSPIVLWYPETPNSLPGPTHSALPYLPQESPHGPKGTNGLVTITRGSVHTTAGAPERTPDPLLAQPQQTRPLPISVIGGTTAQRPRPLLAKITPAPAVGELQLPGGSALTSGYSTLPRPDTGIWKSISKVEIGDYLRGLS